MASILTHEAIVEYLASHNDLQLLKRAKNYLQSNHIRSVTYSAEYSTLVGDVWASMRKESYKCQILMRKGKIKFCTCDCKAGEAERCSHAMAVALYAVDNLTCTSIECRWVAPERPGLDNKGDAIELLKPSLSFNAMLPQDIVPFENVLKSFPTDQRGGLQFRWLVGDEVEDHSAEQRTAKEQELEILRPLIVCIEDIVLSPQYKAASCPTSYLKSKTQVPWDLIVRVAEATQGQSSNPFWWAVRKHRGSGSVFGKILLNVRSGGTFKSLAQKISGLERSESKPEKSVPALTWGRDHEKDGIKAFQAMSDETVEATGAWLHESGLLVASPDGLVGEHAVLEVKCPYAVRDVPLVVGLMSRKDYILQWDAETKSFFINKDHEYYAQMQGAMHLTRRGVCYLIVWHPKDTPIVRRVPKDDEWGNNLDKLVEWMCKKYIPFTFGGSDRLI